MRNFTVTELDANQRVDKYVRKILNDAPLSFIYKLFRKKDVKVNSHWVKIDYVLQKDDEISIFITDKQIEEFNKPKVLNLTKFPYEIVYEDKNILIVNKPSGILVHGDQNEKRKTLSNQVLSYLYSKGEYDPNNKGFVPSPAHRLDRNTSGLVCFAKNLTSLQELEVLFSEKENIEKHYLTLVNGIVKNSGKIDFPLLKDEKTGLVRVSGEGKSALTLYTPIKELTHYTLLDVQILTGRTHQIRVHLKEINHPIIGDPKYGDFKENRLFKEKFGLNVQLLHAYKLKFHNVTGSLNYLSNKTFFASIPIKFDFVLSVL